MWRAGRGVFDTSFPRREVKLGDRLTKFKNVWGVAGNPLFLGMV